MRHARLSRDKIRQADGEISVAAQPSDGDSAGAGRVIVNPISGERIVICQSGAQTGGRLLAFDLFLPLGGHVPARHTHPTQEERFTVVAGAMRFKMRGKTIVAHPGDTVVVPQGTPHWFGAAGDVAAQAHVEVRPALRMEEVFAASADMSHGGQVFGIRMPRIADLARFLLEFQREIAVPNLPARVVKALLIPIAWDPCRRLPRLPHARHVHHQEALPSPLPSTLPTSLPMAPDHRAQNGRQ